MTAKALQDTKGELQRELDTTVRSQGEDAIEVVPVLEKLAVLCHRSGQYAEAQTYYERALKILEKKSTFSSEREALIQTHHHLGLMHRVQGAYDAAEPHYKEALRLSRSHFGQQHPETIARENYLAGLYCAWGKYEQSEKLLKNSLSFYEETLGKEHEVTAITLYAMALVTRRSSFAAAKNAVAPVVGGECKDYYDRAANILKIKIETLAMDNPHDVFRAVMRLSHDRFAEGKFDEAEELFRQSLLMELQEIWPHHPLQADAYQILGDLYRSFGNGSQSEYLYRQALQIRTEVFGENDPKVGASAHSLGTILHTQQRYQEAETFLKQACEVYQKNVFPPVLANSLKALAATLRSLERTQEAEKLESEADEIFANHGHKQT